MLADKDLVPFRVRTKVEKAYGASQEISCCNQEQVDHSQHMAAAARGAAQRLAEMAVEEASYGNARINWRRICCARTCSSPCAAQDIGVIRELPEEGDRDRSSGRGGYAILPTTNPTSTAIYESLVSLSRQRGVLSPHPNVAVHL
jgi:acetaldehyde dehydrogenase/alcohol dehydrogenase